MTNTIIPYICSEVKKNGIFVRTKNGTYLGASLDNGKAGFRCLILSCGVVPPPPFFVLRLTELLSVLWFLLSDLRLFHAEIAFQNLIADRAAIPFWNGCFSKYFLQKFSGFRKGGAGIQWIPLPTDRPNLISVVSFMRMLYFSFGMCYNGTYAMMNVCLRKGRTVWCRHSGTLS